MTEETIRKYFLGEMSEAEAEHLEESLIYDKNLFRQAEIIENEIIDDYLQKRLSKSEQHSFEKNYPITKSRQEKIRSAESFFHLLKETPPEGFAAETEKNFWQSFFEAYPFFKTFAFGVGAVVVLAAVIIGIWLNRQNNQEIASQPDVNQSPTSANENNVNRNIQNHGSNLGNTSNVKPDKSPEEPVKPPKAAPSPDAKPSSPTKIEEKAKPIFASFTLLPGTLRAGGEQTIKISSQTNKVILRLDLPENAVKYQTYRATIKTADGETVFTSSNLTSLNLIIPADKFRKETYIVFLEGISASKFAESVAEYTFRANR